ncbi:hypothetical protein DTO021C3_6986 [Paecilomyces variotii]|nr:hypothetical protein DTO195F2_1379 [Paecilomyces variotii]KAJ9285462.1 hypothetical protein DTO021C3_6986 [Paecilomyces variotii]KAJ9293999.1 hypothetical protein DTO217A2_9235 [Paecilomyces variotii]
MDTQSHEAPRWEKTFEVGQTSSDTSSDRNMSKGPDRSDEADPRNWSPWKKGLLFTALMTSSFLADGAMTWGATMVVPQALEWKISTTHSATSMNYGILLQGFGGIFAVPFIEAYGRFPVWLWPQVITMFMVLGATLSNDWSTFTAFRSLQGLFGTVPQVVGLPIIHDMYDPEDWPSMINIWGTTFLAGPFLGPAIAGYISNAAGWKVSFAVLTGLYGFSTLLVLCFGYETYYARGSHVSTSWFKSLFSIGKTNRAKASTFAYECKTLVLLIFKFPLLLTGIATMVNFTWPIGITTTIDGFLHAAPYLFNTVQASSLRFAGVIGAICGYIFGYYFNEWIFKKRRFHWRPEYRLHGVWVPICAMAGGLLTYGLTLQFGKHWIGLAFGWVLVNTGMIGSTVAITAYALEKYPSHATCVSAIINMWRTCGGFSVGYFQPSWVARDGVGVVFGVQAAIVAVCIVVTIVPVIVTQRGKQDSIDGLDLDDHMRHQEAEHSEDA